MENLQRLQDVKWTSLTLKIPVVFRENDMQFIIRNMRNFKGNVMCECCMDDDRWMRNIKDLPDDVKIMINSHLKIQA